MECPECGNKMDEIDLDFTTFYTCPKCGKERMRDMWK